MFLAALYVGLLFCPFLLQLSDLSRTNFLSNARVTHLFAKFFYLLKDKWYLSLFLFGTVTSATSVNLKNVLVFDCVEFECNALQN